MKACCGTEDMDAVTFSATKTGKLPEEVQEASVSRAEKWTNQIPSPPVGIHQMLPARGLLTLDPCLAVALASNFCPLTGGLISDQRKHQQGIKNAVAFSRGRRLRRFSLAPANPVPPRPGPPVASLHCSSLIFPLDTSANHQSNTFLLLDWL